MLLVSLVLGKSHPKNIRPQMVVSVVGDESHGIESGKSRKGKEHIQVDLGDSLVIRAMGIFRRNRHFTDGRGTASMGGASPIHMFIY